MRCPPTSRRPPPPQLAARRSPEPCPEPQALRLVHLSSPQRDALCPERPRKRRAVGALPPRIRRGFGGGAPIVDSDEADVPPGPDERDAVDVHVGRARRERELAVRREGLPRQRRERLPERKVQA